MEHERPPASAERQREIRHAKILLAKMNRSETIARLSIEAATERLRDRHHALYCKLIGVEPELRSSFRDALVRIAEGEQLDVEAALMRVRLDA